MDIRRRFAAYLLLAAPAVLFLAGCAGKTPKTEERPAINPREQAVFQGRRMEAIRFMQDLNSRKWEYWVHGRDVDFQKLYSERGGLYSVQTLQITRSLGEAVPPENVRGRRQLDYFRRYVLREMVQESLARFQSDIYSLLDAALIQVGDATAPYSAVGFLLENEPDYNVRRAIAAESTQILRLVNPRYEVLMEETGNLARALGYAGAVELAEDLRETNIEGLAAQCETLLALTDDLYRNELRHFAEERLHLPIASLGRPDLPLIFGHEASFDVFFPEEDIIAVCHTTLLRMGIDLNYEGGLSLDTSASPVKNPAPQTFPIKVPTDVRCALTPLPGLRAYQQTLKELAKGLAYASSQNQVWEFGNLGGRTNQEGYAHTLASVVNEPAWLATYTGMDEEDRSEYLRTRLLSELLQMRRACAKILYELDYHRGVEDPRESYRLHLSRAYGLALSHEDTERYLADADPFFDGAPEIRGRWMAAMLVEHFRQGGGAKWHESPRTGLQLRSFWAKGTEPTPGELLAELGLGEPSPEAYLREMRRLIGAQQE